jgi:hypothetical protein
MANPLFYFNGVCVMSLNALYLRVEVGDLLMLCRGVAALELAKMLVQHDGQRLGLILLVQR